MDSPIFDNDTHSITDAELLEAFVSLEDKSEVEDDVVDMACREFVSKTTPDHEKEIEVNNRKFKVVRHLSFSIECSEPLVHKTPEKKSFVPTPPLVEDTGSSVFSFGGNNDRFLNREESVDGNVRMNF